MHSVIFIAGPTASGKTEVSFLLAKQIKGHIISCDSMLIYKEPVIIVCRPPDYMLNEVRHHYISIISVRDSYSIFDYYSSAAQKIIELYNKNIPVIVCGGSGLYMKTILDGIFHGAPRDESLRKNLELKAKQFGNEYLFRELEKADEAAARKISPNDLRRIIRALEVFYINGTPISKKKKEACGIYGKISVRIFGLRMRRELLYERINKRVDKMFEEGVVSEAVSLIKLPLSLTAAKIIGIKEISAFLNGEYDERTAKEKIKQNTRNFAKRQITWFGADKRIEWVDVDNLTVEEIKERILTLLRE